MKSRFARALAAVPVVVLALAGCAASPAAAPSVSPSVSPAPSAAGSPAASAGSAVGPVSLRFTVKDGRSSPPPGRREVSKGQPVEIFVESAGHTEVHVHGYDLLAEAEPGKSAVIRFVADRTGRFDVEAHPDLLLVQLVVR